MICKHSWRTWNLLFYCPEPSLKSPPPVELYALTDGISLMSCSLRKYICTIWAYLSNIIAPLIWKSKRIHQVKARSILYMPKTASSNLKNAVLQCSSSTHSECLCLCCELGEWHKALAKSVFQYISNSKSSLYAWHLLHIRSYYIIHTSLRFISVILIL